MTEKLQRRKSFTKAVLLETLPARTPSEDGPTKEHIEQGRVKHDVYMQYVEAASKIGFALFVLTTILAQVVNVAANNTLRSWGEHNREAGSNKGVGRYLLPYGLFSLSSTVFGAIAAILIWVFCSLRSAKRLHDSVSRNWCRLPQFSLFFSPCRCFTLSCVHRCLSLRRLPPAASSTYSRAIPMSLIRFLPEYVMLLTGCNAR